MDKTDSRRVKVRSVTLTVYPWRHPSGKTYWRFSWYDHNGKRKFTTKAIRSEAIKAARQKATEIHNGTVDLSILSGQQAQLVRAFLNLDPDWPLIERLRAEKNRKQVPLQEAFEKFIEIKKANAGNSPHNVNTLKNRVGHLVNAFPEAFLSDLLVGHLDAWLSKGTWNPSTKKKIRAAAITFFRWCRAQGHLPDQTTEAEKMAAPIVIRKAPSTFTPAELSIMLENVRPAFLPWLAISAWAGVRREEMYPKSTSKKDGLRWEDIDLEAEVITIRPEVSKTNERRIIPTCRVLSKTLGPIHAGSGLIGGAHTPTTQRGGEASETKRLGSLVGGWRSNALRHSFVSYRCALVGVGEAAMEAGNSESETRRSYRDAKTKKEAQEWFNVKNT